MPPIGWQIKPDKLIETARALINHHPAQGRPKQTNLRRGVSTAYYAVFHLVAWEVVLHLLPNGRMNDRFAVVRSVDHGAIKKVCGWIANPNQAPTQIAPLARGLAENSAMVNAALVFLDLQEARHQADYDHTAGFSKPTALRYVDDAEGVIRAFPSIARSAREVFCTLVALEVRRTQ